MASTKSAETKEAQPKAYHIPEGDYLGTEEIAGRLGITSSLVCRYAKEGRIAGFKVGKKWLVNEKDVEEFKQHLRFPSRAKPLDSR